MLLGEEAFGVTLPQVKIANRGLIVAVEVWYEDEWVA